MRRRNGTRRLAQSLSERHQNSVSAGKIASCRRMPEGDAWAYFAHSSFITACRCLRVNPISHLSSAHTLPWFLLSLLDWSRFIREATMRFGVDNRWRNTEPCNVEPTAYTRDGGGRTSFPFPPPPFPCPSLLSYARFVVDTRQEALQTNRQRVAIYS